MKIRTIALAALLAVSSSAAFAQAGGNNAGATLPESSGTAVNKSGRAVGTIEHGRMINREPRTTTGMSRQGPSGPGLEPGARDKSRPGGEGVSDRPAD
jgi:hypothetical protein